MQTSWRRSLLAGLAAAGALAAVPALGQTMTANSAAFNAGYGRVAGEENRPIDPSTRDANGNQLVINGVIMNGNSQSAFASGAASAFAGVGATSGGATAIGNNLTVITQGNDNIVVVDSRQINNGTVTAKNSSVSGNGP